MLRILILILTFSNSALAFNSNWGIAPNNTCIIKNKRPKCWGQAKWYRLNVPKKLKNVKEVVSYDDANCALNNKIITCWGGTNSKGKPWDIPFNNLVNPHNLITNGHTICVTDKKKLRCHKIGYRSQIHKLPDNIKYPELLSLGPISMCYLDNHGQIVCHSNYIDDPYGQLNPPNIFHPNSMEVGETHSCVIKNRKVHCWGNNLYGQSSPPKNLVNPIQITLGYEHTCVLDDEGVKCWGFNFDGQTDVPKFKNPKKVWATGNRTCALDDKKVKCWGENFEGQNDEPIPVKNPTKMNAGWKGTCALHDIDKLNCWGLYKLSYVHYGEFNIPKNLGPVKDFSYNGTHACAITTNKRVRCWGGANSGDITPPNNLVNPQKIAVAVGHSCVIDEGKIKCWGNKKSFATQMKITNPTELKTTNELTCAKGDEGIKCWGNHELIIKNKIPFNDIKKVKNWDISYYSLCVDDHKGLRCWISDEGDWETMNLPKNIKNIKELSINKHYGCLIDDDGLKCWGEKYYHGDFPKNLNKPHTVSVGVEHACVVDNDEVICWGKNYYGQLNVPF